MFHCSCVRMCVLEVVPVWVRKWKPRPACTFWDSQFARTRYVYLQSARWLYIFESVHKFVCSGLLFGRARAFIHHWVYYIDERRRARARELKFELERKSKNELLYARAYKKRSIGATSYRKAVKERSYRTAGAHIETRRRGRISFHFHRWLVANFWQPSCVYVCYIHRRASGGNITPRATHLARLRRHKLSFRSRTRSWERKRRRPPARFRSRISRYRRPRIAHTRARDDLASNLNLDANYVCMSAGRILIPRALWHDELW